MRMKIKEYFEIQKYLLPKSFMMWRSRVLIKILSQNDLEHVGSINSIESRGRMLVPLEINSVLCMISIILIYHPSGLKTLGQGPGIKIHFVSIWLELMVECFWIDINSYFIRLHPWKHILFHLIWLNIWKRQAL